MIRAKLVLVDGASLGSLGLPGQQDVEQVLQRCREEGADFQVGGGGRKEVAAIQRRSKSFNSWRASVVGTWGVLLSCEQRLVQKYESMTIRSSNQGSSFRLLVVRPEIYSLALPSVFKLHSQAAAALVPLLHCYLKNY